jgi:hypothetical protein
VTRGEQVQSGARPNAHIREFLRYYLAFERTPRYAVFLDGPWGVGKSYLVREILEEYFRGWKDQYVWVSLFGLASKADIDDAVFAALYPTLNSTMGAIAGSVSSAALKKFGVDFKVSPKAFLSKHCAKVYVFDDLERCDVPAPRVLGYLNSFVEHSGAKVIVIGDEAMIHYKEDKTISEEDKDNGEKSAYRRQREKIIGKTLQIGAWIDDALRHFITQMVHEGARNFIDDRFDEIKRLCRQAGMQNLRVLQNTLWDFERLYSVLTEQHRGHAEAMLAVMRLFFAVSFELKLGNLQVEDIRQRDSDRGGTLAAVARHLRGDDRKSLLEQAQTRYPDINLNDNVLTNDILINTLARGVINADDICSSLDQSMYFVTTTAQPAWRTVWYGLERSEEEFQDAYLKLERQFTQHEFRIPGELLHVFGLRLWLADLGILPTRAEVVAECEKYIDTLYADGVIASPAFQNSRVERHIGYANLAYFENDTAEFRHLYSYLRDKIEQAKAGNYPAQAHALLEEMASDPDNYFHQMCYTNAGENVYANEPVLSALDPELFVAQVLRQNPIDQRKIMSVFKARYGSGALERTLRSELSWLSQVREKFLSAAEGLPPLSRCRINRQLAWYVDPFLRESEEAD